MSARQERDENQNTPATSCEPNAVLRPETESEIMKRVTVEEGDEGESVAKGMVIADSEIETLEDLKVGNFNYQHLTYHAHIMLPENLNHVCMHVYL